jgi:hypothetical protein
MANGIHKRTIAAILGLSCFSLNYELDAQAVLTPPQTTVTQVSTVDNPFANTIGPYTVPQSFVGSYTQYPGTSTTIYPGTTGNTIYSGTTGYYNNGLPGSLNQGSSMGPGPNGPPQFRQIQPTYAQAPPPAPLPDINLKRPNETFAVPAFGPYYTFPGLVGVRRGAWVGSDYLYNIPFNIKIIVEIVMPDGKLIPLQQASLEKRVARIFEESGIMTTGICNNCGLGTGLIPPPTLPSARPPASPYTGGTPAFRSLAQPSSSPGGTYSNNPIGTSSPIGSNFNSMGGGFSSPYQSVATGMPSQSTVSTPQINLSKSMFDQPSLPFFHILVMPYPLENRYVACCSGRLFEAVKLDRIDFKTQGVIQAITWEKQTLVSASKEEFEDVVDGAVDHITRTFVERLLFYHEIQEDLRERRRYYN